MISRGIVNSRVGALHIRLPITDITVGRIWSPGSEESVLLEDPFIQEAHVEG